MGLFPAASSMGGCSGNITTTTGSYFEEELSPISVGGVMKKRYRRTVYAGTTTSSGGHSAAHGLSSTEVAQIISLSGTMIGASSTSPVVYANATFSLGVTYNVVGSGNIQLYYPTDAAWSGNKVYITIEYYK